MIVSLLLTVALGTQAQLKVAPKLEKGLVKNYVSSSTVDAPGQQAFTVTTDTKYTVTETTADGYVIDVINTECTTDAGADNVVGKVMSASEQLLKGINVRVATNKDGKPEKVVNYDELKGKLDAGADKMVEEIFKAAPKVGAVLSKDALKANIMDNATEDALLKSVSTGVLALSGKTVMTGAQEDYVSDQGLKMKRMYFVNGRSVVTNGSLNMSKDDMKALIVAQVEKSLPDQADMIKQNIDQLIDSGMLKMDMKETATYELADDNWVKSIQSEITNETMGQKSVIKTTVTQK